MKCEICNRECKSYSSLSQHLKNHDMSPKEYYDKYFKKEDEGICECGNVNKFKRLSIGYRRFCSYKCARNSNKTKEKFKKTCLEKYGTNSPIQNGEVKEKRKRNNIEKFGVEYYQLTGEYKNRVKKTNLERYGCECSFKNEEVKEKRKHTMIDKYGVENPFENVDILNKRENTFIQNYGIDNPMKSDEIKNKRKQTNLDKIIPKIKKVIEYLNLELLSEYINYRENIKLKCQMCGTIFGTTYFNLYQGCGKCPKCFPKYISSGENELFEYIKLLNILTIRNDRNILNGKEIDIYIPDKNLAIEFDGLYYHSEEFKNKNYHLDKTNRCNDQNIRLIHIFEDEWVFKQDIVKSRLIQTFNLNNAIQRIHARKCEIKKIDSEIKNEFLNSFHLQGKDSSNIKLGAFYNGELIAVMTFSYGNISKGSKKIDGIYELSRFCSNSSYRIPGIASKLLTYFKRNYEWKEIYSYADRRWSEGNVYFKLGFELDSITKPNYWYVKGINRFHRFNLRKRHDEPRDIPEWILRYKDGYHRIYDCGHLKFIMKR